MALLKTDAFGNFLFIKRLMIIGFGSFAFARFCMLNKTEVEGMEHLVGLSKNKVLFVSNHQTYFSDVAMFYMLFAAAKNRYINRLKNPFFLFNPVLRLYYVAAVETMKAGFLPKVFAYAGSISIKRTWCDSGKDVNRQVDMRDISKIGEALDDGWVITFPQGTTVPYQKGRKGIAHIIKKYDPIIVPIVIDGFRRAFDKKGLRMKKRGVTLKVRIKKPLHLDNQHTTAEIMEQVMTAIEQSEKFSEPINKIVNGKT